MSDETTSFVEALSAVDVLERALDDLEDELAAASSGADDTTDEALRLAAEWGALASEISAEVSPLLEEFSSVREKLEAASADLDALLDGVLQQGDAAELEVSNLRDSLLAQSGRVVAGLEGVAQRSLAVSEAAANTFSPVVRNLSHGTPTLLASARERNGDAVSALLEMLESECNDPVRQKSSDFVGVLASVVDLLGSSLQRNREHVGSEANRVVRHAEESSRSELRDLGGETMLILEHLAGTAQTIAEVLEAANEIKRSLVDGVQLTNSGAQVIIDFLEELDELLGGH